MFQTSFLLQHKTFSDKSQNKTLRKGERASKSNCNKTFSLRELNQIIDNRDRGAEKGDVK